MQVSNPHPRSDSASAFPPAHSAIPVYASVHKAPRWSLLRKARPNRRWPHRKKPAGDHPGPSEAPVNTAASIPREGCHLLGLSILAVEGGAENADAGNLTPFAVGGSSNAGGVSECDSFWTQLQAAKADQAKSPPPSAVTLSKQSRRLRPRERSPLHEHLQLEALGCLEPSGKEKDKKTVLKL